jgi:uncharacterized damage-inducible protein DinB
MRAAHCAWVAISLSIAAPLAAQDEMASAPAAPAAAAEHSAVPAPGLRADFLARYEEVTDKYLQLARRIPAEQYTWRPGPGVRSVAEVLLHVAAMNYLWGNAMGLPMPEGIDPKTLEFITTDKAKIIATLQASFALYHLGVLAQRESGMDSTKIWFGHSIKRRTILINSTDHNGEHLGQMIAYTRVLGLVPPWSLPKPPMHP